MNLKNNVKIKKIDLTKFEEFYDTFVLVRIFLLLFLNGVYYFLYIFNENFKMRNRETSTPLKNIITINYEKNTIN